MRCCWIDPSSVEACARMILSAVWNWSSWRSAAFHTRQDRSDVRAPAPTAFDAYPANASGFAMIDSRRVTGSPGECGRRGWVAPPPSRVRAPPNLGKAPLPPVHGLRVPPLGQRTGPEVVEESHI